MAEPLRSRRLRRILAAYTVNRLGSWLGLVALSLAVWDHTHSALAVAALLLAWQALPAFLVPPLVARVEASQRRSELSALYFLEGVLTSLLALLVWRFSLPGLLVLALFDGTVALAANSLLRAEVARIGRAELTGGSRPTHQARDQETADGAAGAGTVGGAADALAHTAARVSAQEAERSANAALNVAFSVSFVAGPVIGGVVAATAGVPAALLIDVCTFVVCGALLLDLHPHVDEEAGDSVRARMRAAWRYIRAVPSLRLLLAVDAIGLVLTQAGGPIEVALVKATLHGGDQAYGLLVTAWGAGAVIASIIFVRYPRPSLGVTLTSAICAIGLAFVGLAAASTLAFAYFAAFVGGAGNGFYLPSMISLVQRLTPESLQGRLISAVESLSALALAIALPLGGALVALSSPRITFLALGIGILAITPAYARATLAPSSPGSARNVGTSETAGQQ